MDVIEHFMTVIHNFPYLADHRSVPTFKYITTCTAVFLPRLLMKIITMLLPSSPHSGGLKNK